MDLKNSSSNFVRSELYNNYRIHHESYNNTINNISFPKVQSKITKIKIHKNTKSRNRSLKHNNNLLLTLSNPNLQNKTISIMNNHFNNNNKLINVNDSNKKHLSINNLTLQNNRKGNNYSGNGLFRTITDYQTAKEKLRKQINLKLSIDLMTAHIKKKANTDCESLSSLTNNEYKSTDTGQHKSRNDNCKIKLKKDKRNLIMSQSQGNTIEIYKYNKGNSKQINKNVLKKSMFNIEKYKYKQRKKLKLPQTKEYISKTILKMETIKENILLSLHKKVTTNINYLNTLHMKLFNISHKSYQDIYDDCYYNECNININNNDKTSRNKTSTTFSKRIYNQYFTIIPSPMFIINTHHINSIYYNPTTILFELKKEIEYNLNNNNVSSLQNKCSLFSNFDVHNNIITPLMLIPINKCNLITCKGPQNDNYILNFLYKSLPYETSLTNIHITKGISNKTKIINILFNRKNTSTNSNNIKHQETKKHNLYHQLTLTTQERVNDSEKKLTNFKPTYLSTFYHNEHDRYQHKRVSQKLKESLFKTNKKMLRSTQTIKLYNKIINDPLSIDGSISRTQEMNTLTHNHRLNQLIFYIHTNQKVAFINYFEQNNCKEIINHADSSGNVLLIHAIKYNQKDLFQFILENGANVNIANNYGNTPLHFAFAYKNYSLVNELIKCKANEFAQNMKGATPWDCMGLTCD